MMTSPTGGTRMTFIDVKVIGEASFPGEVELRGGLEVTKEIGGPNLAMKVTMSKEVNGKFEKVPCIGDVGSW